MIWSIRSHSGNIKSGWPCLLCGYGIRHASSLLYKLSGKSLDFYFLVGIHLNRIAYLIRVWPLFKSSVVFWRWRDRTCTNFKGEDGHVNNGISIDFVRVKCVSAKYNQPYREKMPRYAQSDQFVQQLFEKDPLACFVQHFAGCCYWLWITGDSLWHWNLQIFNIQIPSYQYKNSHCKDRTISRSSYFYNRSPFTWKERTVFTLKLSNVCHVPLLHYRGI